MSTKIYNGIIFATNDVCEIFEKLISLRPKAIEIGTKLKAQMLTKQVVSIVDQAMVNHKFNITNTKFTYPNENGNVVCTKSGAPKSVLNYVMNEIDEYRQYGNSSRLEFPVELKVILHPISGKILGTDCSTCGELTDLLFKSGLIKEYHYQNQTDKPRQISERQWKIRSDDWDLVFKNIDIPIYSGMMVTILDNSLLPYFIPNEQLNKHVPTINKRIEIQVKNMLYQYYMAEVERETPQITDLGNDRELTATEKYNQFCAKEQRSLNIYFSAAEIVKSSVGQEKKEEFTKTIKGTLLSKSQMVERYLDYNNMFKV